jgi:hypothetical protein
MTFITPNHIAEFLALLTSIIFYRSLKKGKLKSLPFFLLFILLIELTGRYLRKELHVPNTGLYNFSIPVEYSYYLFLFRLHSRQSFKKFYVYCILLLFVLALYYFLATPLIEFHSYVLLAGQIMVIAASCLYIYQVFSSNDELPLYRHYFFWFVTGALLFNLGEFSYFLLYPSIHKSGLDNFDHLFRLINNNLLLLLYLTYIICILMYRKNIATQHAHSF